MDEALFLVLADFQEVVPDLDVVFENGVDEVEVDEIAVGAVDEFIIRELLLYFFEDAAGLVGSILAVVIEVMDIDLDVFDFII